MHLKQIDEDGELCLLDDLGRDHEESSQEDYDDDEILIVDKERHIGSAFQSQPSASSRIGAELDDDED